MPEASSAATSARRANVKLVISDAREDIKDADAKLMNASWRRCRVHAMRDTLARAGKSSRRVVSAFIATAFAQDSADAAKTRRREVALKDAYAQPMPGREFITGKAG
jgi:transposase-like protein